MRKYILGIIAVLILFLSGILVFKMFNEKMDEIEGIIIVKENNQLYETFLIKTYEEYQNILNKHNALGKISKEDFNEFDYIVDYVPYIKDMQILDISVNVKDLEELDIVYDLSVEVKDTDKLLVNFIQVPKNRISGISSVNKSYK